MLCILGFVGTVHAAGDYTLVSGDYRICISPKYKHTIRSIEWKGYMIGTATGYYGAIVIPAPGKYIGAGHTEGGVEDVKSVIAVCDGRKVDPKAEKVIRGERITVEKISGFDNLLFRVRLELTPEGLIEINGSSRRRTRNSSFSMRISSVSIRKPRIILPGPAGAGGFPGNSPGNALHGISIQMSNMWRNTMRRRRPAYCFIIRRS